MEEECTICFGPLAEADPDDEGDGAVRTLVCGHCFHANCIGSYRMNSFVATEGAFLTLALSRHLICQSVLVHFFQFLSDEFALCTDTETERVCAEYG